MVKFLMASHAKKFHIQSLVLNNTYKDTAAFLAAKHGFTLKGYITSFNHHGLHSST